MFIKRLGNTFVSANKPVWFYLIEADSMLSRLKGLMFNTTLPITHALLLKRCNWIHSLFMLFPIDVIYFDRSMTIIDIRHLKPFRFSFPVFKADCVLEIGYGLANKYNITKGDRFEIYE